MVVKVVKVVKVERTCVTFAGVLVTPFGCTCVNYLLNIFVYYDFYYRNYCCCDCLNDMFFLFVRGGGWIGATGDAFTSPLLSITDCCVATAIDNLHSH